MSRIPKIGPWLLSTTTTSSAVGSILLSKDVKRYAKFEVTVNTELTDLSVLSFVLIVEVAISDPAVPVLSRSAKNVLKRFPSWMSMYSDSNDQATPSVYIPTSVGGKFINAILGETLDDFDREIDLHRVNSYIETADTNQIAWIYSSSNVNNIFNKVLVGEVELARVDNFRDFIKLKNASYVFYHNPLNREILTLEKYNGLKIRNENTNIEITLEQNPVQVFNWFDEFGLRVGLSRLYLEDNVSYKARILDVFKNPNGVDIESFKKTLRRELNLWKAFSATPDSNHLGATPEILEIADIESSTPYFTAEGNPTDKFKNLVESLNIKYPTNWGYFAFDDAIWDYAGEDNQGAARITSRYYDDDIDLIYYQPGVGDFDDAKIIIQNLNATPQSFETKIIATGKKKTGITYDHSPISLGYEYYGSYDIIEYQNQTATTNFTLEFHATPHSTYTAPTTFYTTIRYYPKNNFDPTHPSSPEYRQVEIFDTEGFVKSDYLVQQKDTNAAYKNTTSSVANARLNIKDILNMVLRNGIWNGSTYATPNSDNFLAKFSHRTNTLANSSTLLGATPNFTESTKVEIVSKLYNPVSVSKNTKTQSSYLSLNSSTPPTEINLNHTLIYNNILFPNNSTPTQIHIKNIKPTNVEYGYTESSSPLAGYGGESYYSEIDENIFIPSSPNILLSYYSGNTYVPSSNAKVGTEIINSGAATANYYFTELSYPYNSTPNRLTLKTQDSNTYPHKKIKWESFELDYATPIRGLVDENGIVNFSSANGEYIPGKNSDIIQISEITREDFGLSGQAKFDYFFENIKIQDPESTDVSIWSEQEIIDPFLNRTYVLYDGNMSDLLEDPDYTTKAITYPSNSVKESYDSERNTTVFSNFVARGRLFDSKLDTRIHTGWLHVSNEEKYIFAKPITEIFSGEYKTINLSGMPRQGSPVIVKVSNAETSVATPYYEIAFYDLATPNSFGFYNEETIKPSFDNSFYLGYSNVYDVSITDGLTGELLFEDLESSTNKISVASSSYSFSTNREYVISYKVRNSYYIDYDISNANNKAFLVFDATPTSAMDYEIIYENSLYENSTPINIDLGQTTSFLDKGYIIYSETVNPFDTAVVKISPSYIMDDQEDYITITVVSLDSIGNPKPYQSFELSSGVLSFDNSIITTDEEGFASTSAVYSGLVSVNKTISSYLTVTGIISSINPQAHPDSDTSGFSSIQYFDIYSSYDSAGELIATVDPSIVVADANSSVIVSGLLTSNNLPQKNNVIYWKKGRTLYQTLNQVSYSINDSKPTATASSGIVYTDQNGKFEIGPITSQDRATPGYWFISVESELQEEPTISPSVVVGDSVFWYESYDNIDINYIPNLRMPDTINYDPANSLTLYATPSFRLSYYSDGGFSNTYTGSTPRWTPPVWMPVSRYEQYQAGYLGSTPNMAGDFSGLINDVED